MTHINSGFVLFFELDWLALIGCLDSNMYFRFFGLSHIVKPLLIVVGLAYYRHALKPKTMVDVASSQQTFNKGMVDLIRSQATN